MGIIHNDKILFTKEAANKCGKRKKKSKDKSLFRMGRYRREIIVSRLEPGSSPHSTVKKEQTAFSTLVSNQVETERLRLA